jgi:Asp-tRNA(Asn)/Glu-tRNA(Gln) amidotransferase B subunit
MLSDKDAADKINQYLAVTPDATQSLIRKKFGVSPERALKLKQAGLIHWFPDVLSKSEAAQRAKKTSPWATNFKLPGTPT